MKNKTTFFNKHWFALLATLIIAISIVVRFTGLGSVPVSLYWDEVAMLVDAKSIAATGNDFHGLPSFSSILPSYGDYKLPVYILLSTPLMLLPVAHEVQIRLLSAFAGVVTVILAGFFASEIALHWQAKKRKIFILSSLFITALLPWSIVFSHTAFEGHLGQLLVSASLLCVAMARRKPWLLVLSGVLGAIGLETYYSVRFVWPLTAGLFWLGFLLSGQVANKKRWFLFGLVMMLIFCSAWFGMTKARWYSESEQIRLSSESVLDTSRYVMQQNVLREQAGNSRIDRLIFHRTVLQLQAFSANLGENINPAYLFISGDSNLRHGTGFFGLAHLFWLPLLPLGMYVLWRKEKVWLLLLLGWWLTALVPASVPDTVPHALRSLNGLMPFSLLLGVGLFSLLSHSKKIWKVFGMAIVLLSLISAILFSYFYLEIYPELSSSYWQDGYKQVVEKIVQVQKPNSIIVLDVPDSVFSMWYLAYAINPLDYSKIEQANFRPVTYNNVRFSLMVFEDIESMPGNVIVAGEEGTLRGKMAHLKRKPIREWIIPSSDSVKSYLILEFE